MLLLPAGLGASPADDLRNGAVLVSTRTIELHYSEVFGGDGLTQQGAPVVGASPREGCLPLPEFGKLGLGRTHALLIDSYHSPHHATGSIPGHLARSHLLMAKQLPADGLGEGWLLRRSFNIADFLRRHLFVSSIHQASFASDRERLRAVEWEMLIWLLAILALLLLSLLWSGLAWIGVAVAAVRWLNIVGFSLYSVLADASQKATGFASLRRSVVMGIVNLVTVWAAFAVVYRAVGQAALELPNGQQLASVSQAAYLSWTTLLTMGSVVLNPRNWAGRLLVMVELGTGLLVIVMTLGALIGALRIEEKPR